MKFKKGDKKPPTSGRKKGSTNKSMLTIRQAIQKALEDNQENLTKWIAEAGAKSGFAGIQAYATLTEFVQPKLARTEVHTEGEINHSLTLIKKIEAVNPNGASLNGSGNLHLHTGAD